MSCDNLCSTNCIEYTPSTVSPGNLFVNIDAGSYFDCCADPQPLFIRILTPQIGADVFTITMGAGTSNPITFTVTLGVSIIISNNNPGVNVSAEIIPSTQILEIDVELSEGNTLPPNSYILHDKYHIIAIDGLCGTRNLYASAGFERSTNLTISSDLLDTPLSLIFDSQQNIPRIHLEAQTTINGSDIGDAVFTIYDEFTYYDKHTIPDNTCKNRTSDNIKTTIFRQCCPYIVSVVKGEGNTLSEKIRYLFNQGDTNNPNSYVFYQNMMLYAMAKYILSRLLYGKFNINYLLGKYNEKFLKKLSESRFCKFIEYFEENDYNKYFLYNK